MDESQGHDDADSAVFWDAVWTLDEEWHPVSALAASAQRPAAELDVDGQFVAFGP